MVLPTTLLLPLVVVTTLLSAALEDQAGVDVNLLDATDPLFPDEDVQQRYEDARKMLKALNISDDAEGPCSLTAQLDIIREACAATVMTADAKKRLAIVFTNCHLENFDLPTYPCPPEESAIKNCVRKFRETDKAFNAYTEFITHIDNLCAYARAEIFQQQSLRASANLYNAGVDTARLLRKFRAEEEERFNVIFQNMEKAEQSTNELVGQTEKIGQVYDKTLELVEHSQKIGAKLDDIRNIDLQVLAQLFSVQTVVFYLVLFGFGYLSTMFKKTSNARVQLFFWAFLCGTLEHFYRKKFGTTLDAINVVEYWRYAVLLMSALILLRSWSSYVDVYVETHKQVVKLGEQRRKKSNFRERRRLVSAVTRGVIRFRSSFSQDDDEPKVLSRGPQTFRRRRNYVG